MKGLATIVEGTKLRHTLRAKIAAVLLAALISAGAALLLDVGGALESLQLKAYDAMYILRYEVAPPAADAPSPIALVEIDDRTLDEKEFRIPRVLWHNYFNTVITGLADAGARVIVLDFLLPQEIFDDLVPDYSRTWLRALVHAKSKNAQVISGMVQSAGRREMPEARYLQIIGPEGLGVFNITTDADDFSRRQRLIFPSGDEDGQGIYSVSFLAARAYRPGLEAPAEVIHLDFNIGRPGPVRTSFAEVYRRAVQGDAAFLAERFKDRIVLIGETDSLTQDRHPTPLYYLTPGAIKRTPGVVIMAHAIGTILGGNFFTEASLLLRLAIYLILAGAVSAYTILGSRRLLAILFPILLVGYPAVAVGALAMYLILPVVGGVAALFIAQGLSFGYRYLTVEREKEEAEGESAEVSRTLGLNFQSQGLLDLALTEFKKVPVGAGMGDVLYNLALDYERKRQFRKAKEVYEYINAHAPGHKDVEAKISKMEAAAGTAVFGLGTAAVIAENGSIIFDSEIRPTLGRYEIIETLGRGAMGTVYLGKDPKIGRLTAIKTVQFSEHYEEHEAERLKENFFREAETVGRLSHPNIVTIYDAGEEQDLSYIAMELLDGHDLKPHTKPDNLLPVRKVLEITANVADALGYAHNQGVVHRDVKPANIMLLKNGTVKVADFGVARVMASSKTKTGVIKGTPYYMSPEQIMGQKVDGRSDVFALGVVLYELLCGRLPFQAEDLEALIFKVTGEEFEPVTTLNPKLPKVLNQIMEKALAKNREQRYQKAEQMAQHLRMVAQKIDEAVAKKKAGVKKKN